MVSSMALAEFAHVLFGMMWVGVSVYIELVLAPILKKAKEAGEFRRLLPILGKTSAFQMLSAILAIVTGFVYLLLLYEPLDSILSRSSGQLILVSLALVLAALVNGIVFLKPTAMKIAKASWPEDPTAPIPEEVKTYQRKLSTGSLLNTLIVVAVLFLMVLAATGGL